MEYSALPRNDADDVPLYRAAGSSAVSGSAAFTDVAADAYYAKAVKWAEAQNITSGIGGGLFGSDNNCTRAQIVTFIWRYMGKRQDILTKRSSVCCFAFLQFA